MAAGALGAGISGSGPSIFALSKGKNSADAVAQSMQDIYQNFDIPFDIHVSKINLDGVRAMPNNL